MRISDWSSDVCSSDLPDADQLETILRIASRIPDHGKLHPWRFVHVPRETRAAFAELLHRAYREERPDPGRLDIEEIGRGSWRERVGQYVMILVVPGSLKKKIT